MAERATILQGIQLGVETTPGTAVAANKKLQATSVSTGVKAEIKKFRPTGSKFNTISALGKEWVEGDISGVLSYTDWVYLAASGLQYTAPDQQEATAAYLWENTPGHSSADTVKTFTIEEGSSVRAHKFAYGLVSNLGYTINRDEATVKGKIIGQTLSDAITMTSTPTEIPIVPVLPSDISVYMDTLYSDIGETKLLRVLKIDFDTGERFGTVWPIDGALASFAAHVETEPTAEFKLLLAADAVGMGLLTSMRAGTKKFFRVEAVGETIEDTYTYKWTHDICATVTDVSQFSDEDGIYAIEFTFTATYDSDLTKAFSFSTINKLTAL
jgi:hypothetical protein